MITAVPKWALYGAGIGVALIVINRMTNGGLISGAAAAVAQVPFDLTQGVLNGTLGVPITTTQESKTQCQRALETGDDWGASFYCPAGTWFKGLFDGK